MPLNRPLILSTLAAAALLPLGAVQAAGVPGQGTWETTLLPRDINHDGTVDAFYDTVLNVSWLADADAAGRINWANANVWAANLDVYGKTGWRLPTMIDTGAPGYDCTYGGTDCGFNVQTISADGKTVFSEMAHLYYVSLGNQGLCDTGGDCSAGNASRPPNNMLTNTGGFRNLYASDYWSGVDYAPYYPLDYAWRFATNHGGQSPSYKVYEFHAFAVRLGDVTAAVPEPQTYALLLAGLGLLAVAVRLRSPR